jgi:hypothetical protein
MAFVNFSESCVMSHALDYVEDFAFAEPEEIECVYREYTFDWCNIESQQDAHVFVKELFEGLSRNERAYVTAKYRQQDPTPFIEGICDDILQGLEEEYMRLDTERALEMEMYRATLSEERSQQHLPVISPQTELSEGSHLTNPVFTQEEVDILAETDKQYRDKKDVIQSLKRSCAADAFRNFPPSVPLVLNYGGGVQTGEDDDEYLYKLLSLADSMHDFKGRKDQIMQAFPNHETPEGCSLADEKKFISFLRETEWLKFPSKTVLNGLYNHGLDLT